MNSKEKNISSSSPPWFAPLGTAEEFAAAMEASTGREFPVPYEEPMDGKAIQDAVTQLLLTPRPDRGLDVLERTDILRNIFPELQNMVGFGEGIRHKDVWNHTKLVVLRTPCRPITRWTALFHDIGKVPTRKFDSCGQVTFLGHPEVGARMFKKLARRISLDEELSIAVSRLIAFHLRASAYAPEWTDSAVRRFVRDIGDTMEDLLDLSRADITSKYEEKVRRGIMVINQLAERISVVKAMDNKPKPLPKGLGLAISERFDIAPGPRLGALMSILKQEVEKGTLEIQADYNQYLDFIADNKLLEDTQVSCAPGQAGSFRPEP